MITRAALSQVDKMAWTFETAKSFTAPSGEYYIGDLIGVLLEDADQQLSSSNYKTGLYKKTEKTCFFLDFARRHSGVYKGSDKFKYDTDSGTLGICSIDLLFKESVDLGRGKIHTFTEPVHCECKDGKFIFTSGSVVLTI